MNLHVVTGHKPTSPRHGHLLADGTRAHMTSTVYEGMAKVRATSYDHDKGKNWQRGEVEGLQDLLEDLKIDSGGLDWEKLAAERVALSGDAEAQAEEQKVKGQEKEKEVQGGV